MVSSEYNWNISSSELIEQLKWMNIKTRRDYFISLIVFKTVNDFGLNNLLNELTVTQDYHNLIPEHLPDLLQKSWVWYTEIYHSVLKK